MTAVTDLRKKVQGRMPQYDLRNKMANRWASLPRWGRAALTLVAIAFFYVLPNLTIPIVDTPTPWASVLFSPIALYIIAALGLNIVVGYAGLLDLGTSRSTRWRTIGGSPRPRISLRPRRLHIGRMRLASLGHPPAA
jgi:hypothetical protein